MALTAVHINICVGLFLLSITGSSPLSISKFEVPRSVKLNETVTLECNHTLNDGESEQRVIVKWWWKPLTGDDEVSEKHLIYQRIGKGKPLTLHIHNIEIKSGDAIDLSNVTPANSGTYECEVTNVIDEYRQSEKLMVYSEGTGPVMNLTIVDDEDDDDDNEADVVITCLAENVAPEPDLVISVKSPPGISLDAPQELLDLGDGTYNVNASMKIPKELFGDSDAEFSCELFYKDREIAHPEFKTELIYTTGNVEVTEEVTEEEPTLSAEAEPTPPTDGASRYTHTHTTIILVFISFLILF